MAKQTTCLLVRIDPNWAKEVKTAAERKGISQNAWLATAIRRTLDEGLHPEIDPAVQERYDEVFHPEG